MVGLCLGWCTLVVVLCEVWMSMSLRVTPIVMVMMKLHEIAWLQQVVVVVGALWWQAN